MPHATATNQSDDTIDQHASPKRGQASVTMSHESPLSVETLTALTVQGGSPYGDNLGGNYS